MPSQHSLYLTAIAAQFSLGTIPFLSTQLQLGGPTHQPDLAHLQTPPYDPGIVSGKNMQSKQVRGNLCSDFVVIVGKKCLFSVGAAKI